MSWVLLLIELIPTLVKVVTAIMELIKQLPTRAERKVARGELRGLAKLHVGAMRKKEAGIVEMAAGDATRDFAALLERLKARVES